MSAPVRETVAVIPSSEAVALNIRKTIDGIVGEIGKRMRASGVGETAAAMAEVEARQVLIDWFLGDWTP